MEGGALMHFTLSGETFMALVATFAGMSILGAAIHFAAVSRLRRLHPEVWQSRGASSELSARMPRTYLRILGLFYSRRLFDLGDRTLAMVVVIRNLLEILSLLLFVILFWVGTKLGGGGPHFL